jgi:Tfp pilus assembly protein PilN
MAAAFGALIAAGPLLTLVGANMLAARERSASAALQNQLAPRLQAEDAARTARTALANAAGRASAGEVLETLAGVLPPEAALARLERTADGGLELDVTGGDPDGLRAAVRRAPEFAGMRNTSQRRTDATMIVSMREDAR